jgi:hypothetical protein
LVKEKFTYLGLVSNFVFQDRGWRGNKHLRLQQYFIEEIRLSAKIAKSLVRLANRTNQLTYLRKN